MRKILLFLLIITTYVKGNAILKKELDVVKVEQLKVTSNKLYILDKKLCELSILDLNKLDNVKVVGGNNQSPSGLIGVSDFCFSNNLDKLIFASRNLVKIFDIHGHYIKQYKLNFNIRKIVPYRNSFISINLNNSSGKIFTLLSDDYKPLNFFGDKQLKSQNKLVSTIFNAAGDIAVIKDRLYYIPRLVQNKLYIYDLTSLTLLKTVSFPYRGKMPLYKIPQNLNDDMMNNVAVTSYSICVSGDSVFILEGKLNKEDTKKSSFLFIFDFDGKFVNKVSFPVNAKRMAVGNGMYFIVDDTGVLYEFEKK